MSIQAEDLNITVIGPDDGPAVVPMSIPTMGKTDPGHDALFSTTPDLYGSHHDGSSSGVPGYSTPATPYSISLDFEHHQTDIDQLFTPINPVSPTSGLSPSFTGLTLSEYPNDHAVFNSNSMMPKDASYPYPQPATQDSTLFHPGSRASLQLTIPSHQNMTANLTEPYGDIFNFDTPDGLDSALLTPDSQGLHHPSYSLIDTLNQFPSPLENNPDLSRPMRNHHRGLSVAGTSWTAAASPSSTLTSPSLSFTPTDYQNSGSLLEPPSPYDAADVDAIFAGDIATVQRRHSHGGHGRSSSRSDRGRSHSRNAAPSASSSRRSSPYPSPRPSCSPSETLSPHQLWDSNHLAVPTADALAGVGAGSISRRHSFSAYRPDRVGRPQHQQPQHNGSTSVGSLQYQDDTSPIRKVASSAGIKAAEARRTKEAKFRCDICGQTFTTNHNLKNHMNVHLGVKEHACGSCNRPFTTQSVLARHLKTCKMAKSAQS